MSTRPAEQHGMWPARRSRDRLRWRSYRTPWGEGRVASDDSGLRLVELPRVGGERPGAEAEASRRQGADEGTAAQDEVLDRWAAALEEYFRGERLGWSREEIPWDALGVSPFERAVYEALVSVPAGETVSYGRLAEMAGRPRAARAVGTAMANNPIPVVIPCHRVIRGDGTLGNYGDDPDWKPRLLEHERSALAGRGTG